VANAGNIINYGISEHASMWVCICMFVYRCVYVYVYI
jgi:hypothetical protein